MAIKKALALGTYEGAPYHPFTGVDKVLEQVLADDFAVDCTDDYGVLNDKTLSGYDLFISYTEFDGVELSDEAAAALVSFVARGGGLLAIHNGISLQRRHELAALIGGYFTHHPEFTDLPIRIAPEAAEHPVVQGLAGFTLGEEPYRFDRYPHYESTVLAEYEQDGQLWPAAWAHGYGLGRVVYVMPGHHLPSFQVKEVQDWIRRGAQWAAKRI
ncbi:ThuA domain-containing protein [Gorillibacterium sp. sgz500922]|uniref:ThuA domain-containing protein n=1 Tax=Gorillibacterium sp. sgz500922 TaxID=3446694 RepID=UPI003F667EAA